METPDKWQIQNEVNTNKIIGIYTHPVYTHKQNQNNLKKQRKKAKRETKQKRLTQQAKESKNDISQLKAKLTTTTKPKLTQA